MNNQVRAFSPHKKRTLAACLILIYLISESQAMGELTKCDKVTSLAAWRDHNTIVETTMKMLAGTWISEG